MNNCECGHTENEHHWGNECLWGKVKNGTLVECCPCWRFRPK